MRYFTCQGHAGCTERTVTCGAGHALEAAEVVPLERLRIAIDALEQIAHPDPMTMRSEMRDRATLALSKLAL